MSVAGIVCWSLASALFAWGAIRSKALTTGGALAASALGLTVILMSGPVWLAPLVFFFGSSLALARLLKPQRVAASDDKQGSPRDVLQVLCNGLPYAVLAVWSGATPQGIGVYLLISMAVATSDTWSSEVGIALRGRTFDIMGFKRILPGRSGGVSLAGSVAGVAGALCVALLAFILPVNMTDPMRTIAVIAVSGFCGMLLDSALGSLFQARYSMAGNEVGDRGDRLVGGFRWMTNDLVNLLSNAITTGAALWLLE